MAKEIAGLRVAESRLPEVERVFSDPYAERFFSKEELDAVQTPEQARARIDAYSQIMPGVNGAIVSRIKFIDDYLASCIRESLEQVVMIGAGYDTRAYRLEGLKNGVAVFEVDHPATQTVKIETIEEIFGERPGRVHFVPVVFGQDKLDEALFASGYRKEGKTLFIIEGLLMYIPPPAVDGLLSFIATASRPGSSLVADYFHTDVIDGSSDLPEAMALKQFVENAGSGLMFGLAPGTEADFFERRGFHQVKTVSAVSCKDRYFRGESAKRAVSPMFNFLTAVVAPK
jgi:methyltransferase (TIGR00027 family)